MYRLARFQKQAQKKQDQIKALDETIQNVRIDSTVADFGAVQKKEPVVQAGQVEEQHNKQKAKIKALRDAIQNVLIDPIRAELGALQRNEAVVQPSQVEEPQIITSPMRAVPTQPRSRIITHPSLSHTNLHSVVPAANTRQRVKQQVRPSIQHDAVFDPMTVDIATDASSPMKKVRSQTHALRRAPGMAHLPGLV